ncbi:MAG TPA: GNAT family N-acetyltransferase [Burkholderiaceae bacterium]|nr:GNAT family N-acetyltransferase [Burkholderiaceae bacterium]
MNDLPEITTERLRVAHARPEQAAAHAAFMARNREHFERWEPPRSSGVETPAYWTRQLAQAIEDFHADNSVRFVLFPLEAPTRLIGRVNFTQIYRGPFQSAVLGYQIDVDEQGKGLMHEALQAAVSYMFEVRRLHRIEANYLQENERSARLLERLGFVLEGMSRAYLFIDGAWRDHVRAVRINEAFDASVFDAGA